MVVLYLYSIIYSCITFKISKLVHTFKYGSLFVFSVINKDVKNLIRWSYYGFTGSVCNYSRK
nr:MAG TPA: hypothetical protein [Bacteriophage sp.]DAH37785.1 MAG TPA: hypothetical protein [Caudoviricetes sp.]